jgi:hypothetical protein
MQMRIDFGFKIRYNGATMSQITEADIFSRVIDPSNPSLSPEAARALLEIGFSETDHARMAELAGKSNDGSITEDERRELQGYVFVGDVLSMFKAKARASLHKPAA